MLSWPGESVALGVCTCMWEGNGFGKLDLGQKGPSASRLLCHLSRLLHLCSLWQNTSLLFLHIFKVLLSPEEVLMQMIYGTACPSPSYVFCEHSPLHCCVSSLVIRMRGPHHPGPKNVYKMPLVRGRKFVLKKIYAYSSKYD